MAKPIAFVTPRSFGRVVDDGLRLLKKNAVVKRNPYDRPLSEEELIEHLQDVDGMILGGEKCTANVLASTNRLGVIGRRGTGVDNIDLRAATKRGVVVTFTPHVNALSVAEYAFALILSLVRKIPQSDKSTKHGKWESLKFVGCELSGKNLGIIGLGRIGSEVAKRARGFDMNVLYYDRCRHEALEDKLGVSYVTLEQLLRESDIVSIHVPLSPETEGLIGKQQLSMMKETSYLVNTARGRIIDEKALIAALRKGNIAGAAIDVFSREPPSPESALLRFENVIATPHIAFYTIEAIRRMDLMVAEDVIKVLRGETPQHVANPEVLEKHAALKNRIRSERCKI